MKSFKNKKVLLIAPLFFGYEKEVHTELLSLGAEVDFLPDRPFKSPLLKAVTRFNRSLILPYADHYYKSGLNKFGRSHYDIILVIQGEGLSPNFLKYIKSAYPDSKLILYMWDSFRNKPSLVKNLKYYDRASSFDPIDSEKYGMLFRPLFFSKGYSVQDVDHRYDISFIGTAHSDRYAIVERLNHAMSREVRKFWYLYLQSKWLYHVHKVFNPNFRRSTIADFQFNPISKVTLLDVFFASKAILDIEHPSQTGLTMRSIEALGAGKKMITTNKGVEKYDFFNPENIIVIDRHKIPKIPDYFFEKPYVNVASGVYEKYSISTWLSEILDI